jgi:two-component system osmolarity sensor histidine kinase EnvZ
LNYATNNHVIATGPAGLETAPAPLEMRPKPRVGLSLFWRTFFLVAMLLLGSIVAWFQTFRSLEFEPRTTQTAQQIATLVNLSRAALLHTDGDQRAALVAALADLEGVRIVSTAPGEKIEPYDAQTLDEQVVRELSSRLAATSTIARSVNGQKGLWISFNVNSERFWLILDRNRFAPVGGKTWLIWLITAGILSLAGSALIARLINRPLKQLSFAASRVRDGDFDASRLDEKAVTSEIREVNIGFNRMAQQLSKIEQDRAVMLAGISHDLRTPLARLRLETEMSVADIDARDHMASDIDQLDAIIDKFLDYARPDHAELKPVLLNDVIESCLYAVQDNGEMRIRLDVAKNLYVLADEVELTRVLSNLVENARRYGKTPETGIATVDIAAKPRGDWVLLKVRDHGMGVAVEMLPNLIKPFFRGDAARTAATGAGLGLAIVDKTVQRMGGIFALANTTSGGLAAHIKLQKPKKT